MGTAAERSPEEERVRAALAGLGRWAGQPVTLRRAVTPLLMPLHRGVENESWIVRPAAGQGSVFARLLCEDRRAFVDSDAALAAARSAAGLGIAPAVEAADASCGLIVFADLSTDWRTAGVEDLQQRDLRAAVIAAKRAFHRGPSLPLTRSVFDWIARQQAALAAIAAGRPEDYAALSATIAGIAAAIRAAGADAAPCHGDGVASNVLWNGRGEVRLVDFDHAANDDPWRDLAAFLLDVEPWDEGILAAIEIYAGSARPVLFNRVKLYMIVEDFAWATWALLAHRTSPRRQLEFLKYAEFRFLRCRYHLRSWPLETLLRGL